MLNVASPRVGSAMEIRMRPGKAKHARQGGASGYGNTPAL
jgi:hypothetical protein